MMLGRSLSIGFIILSGLVLAAGSLSGAEVTISSRPQGSTVELSGATRVSGAAPFEFSALQGGHFRVRLLRPGFETSVGWIELSPPGPSSPFRVEPKLHLPDVALSLSGLAGPSKFLRGERQKGIVLSIAQGAALVGASVEEWRARDFRSKYDETRDKYRVAQSEEEAAFYHAEMKHNYELTESALESRNGYLIAAAVPAAYVLVENFLLGRRDAFVAVRGEEVTFGLRPVSMPAAMLRGALFPGMGHVYAGHGGLGAVWSASVLSAVGAALVADGSYRDSRVEYDEALSAYRSADTEEAARLARTELESSFESMEDAYQLRRVLRGVAVGLWVLSVLDAGRAATVWQGGVPAFGERSLSLDVRGVSNGLQVALSVPLE
ncbi:MAG: PEGA domain-containing protein [Candidatus Eiseniibacteriota bacterium]|nr:MAG: PEGA domain-containing protein [Candidatus Eisenbacteria bacterium]